MNQIAVEFKKQSRHQDKLLLQTLSDALDISPQRIRLDPCRDWNIKGSKGHIFTDTIWWYVYIAARSTRIWNNLKRKLDFIEVSQDGDEEGILKLERMPTPLEAKTIRAVIGLRPKTHLTEEQRTELRERLNAPSQKGV